MKKILLFTLLFLCSYAAVAQVVSDSVNTALPMTYSTPIRCNLNVAYLPIPSRL